MSERAVICSSCNMIPRRAPDRGNVRSGVLWRKSPAGKKIEYTQNDHLTSAPAGSQGAITVNLPGGFPQGIAHREFQRKGFPKVGETSDLAMRAAV